MISFPNNNYLAQSVAELPASFIGAKRIYLDVETSSGDPEKMSINPHHDCRLLGFGITVDDCPDTYYIDYLRSNERQQVLQYLQDLIWYADYWINHNVKYDAHVCINEGIVLSPQIELVCTIVKAKLKDSDRGGARGGYALDKLVNAWLKIDISPYEERMKPYLKDTKDYASVPIDILAEYCCVDCQSVRLLDMYIQTKLPDRCKAVTETEMKLTKELVKLEQFGMRFDPFELQKAQYIAINRMYRIDEELTKLVGRSFRPTVNDDCDEILRGQYGLPIVRYTNDDTANEDFDNASYDKKALALYEALPYAPVDIIKLIREYRKLSQRNSLFMEPWQRIAPDGIIHPNYNQIVRTGRMSCSDPNAQQIDEFMASLIIPRQGNAIISTDASNIEYRMIVHYINNKRCIEAFRNDPDTDFHQLIDDLVKDVIGVSIGRKAAKTLNFQHGFGAGKKSVIAAIKSNIDVVNYVKAQVEAMGLSSQDKKVETFDTLIQQMGAQIYDAYHKALPELKPTFKLAEETCKSINRKLGTAPGTTPHYYGYITNLAGRDRHLPYAQYRTDYKTPDPYDMAWLAFPTVNSSSAADLMKERFVYLMREVIKELPIQPIALVHDEMVFEAPLELANDYRTIRDIIATLENPAMKLSVPVRWSIGVSDKNWLDASESVAKGGKSSNLQYDPATADGLNWTRAKRSQIDSAA